MWSHGCEPGASLVPPCAPGAERTQAGGGMMRPSGEPRDCLTRIFASGSSRRLFSCGWSTRRNLSASKMRAFAAQRCPLSAAAGRPLLG